MGGQQRYLSNLERSTRVALAQLFIRLAGHGLEGSIAVDGDEDHWQNRGECESLHFLFHPQHKIRTL